jgi:hypothetical protein
MHEGVIAPFHVLLRLRYSSFLMLLMKAQDTVKQKKKKIPEALFTTGYMIDSFGTKTTTRVPGMFSFVERAAKTFRQRDESKSNKQAVTSVMA